jgi:hypothetical protein
LQLTDQGADTDLRCRRFHSTSWIPSGGLATDASGALPACDAMGLQQYMQL